MRSFSLPKLVLIADDDADTRDIVGSAVSLLGCTTMFACDGPAAVKLLAETQPDLAILDVMMPGMTGLEVCDHLKKSPDGELIPVLILTARDGLQDKVSALEDGADDYLTKPFNFRELQARIRALLRVRDLNVRLQASNEELKAMQQRLVDQERQLAVNQLAGATAHQLGQPLAAIMLHCHLIESLDSSDTRYQKALQSLKSDSKRLAEMIGQMKDANAQKTSTYHGSTQILEWEKKG